MIKGTSRDDELLGTDRADTLLGLAGDDEIYAFNGDDLIDAGGGDDYVVGGPGTNTIHGGGGNDYISSTGGDFLYGESGRDQFSIGSKDRAFGGSGNDEFVIADRNPIIDGGEGIDVVAFKGTYRTFTASYEAGGMRIGTARNNQSVPRPEVLMDETIEKIRWNGLTVDRRELTAPAISYLYDDVGQVFDGGTATGHVQQIAGTADPFARVTIKSGDDVVGVCVARYDGSWTLHKVDADLFQDSVTLVAQADYAMNSVRLSEEFEFEMDAAAGNVSSFELV